MWFSGCLRNFILQSAVGSLLSGIMKCPLLGGGPFNTGLLLRRGGGAIMMAGEGVQPVGERLFGLRSAGNLS